MSADATLMFESGGEIVQWDPATHWSCTCGATTTREGRIPNAAPEVCLHVAHTGLRIPVAVALRMLAAARAAQSHLTTT